MAHVRTVNFSETENTLTFLGVGLNGEEVELMKFTGKSNDEARLKLNKILDSIDNFYKIVYL